MDIENKIKDEVVKNISEEEQFNKMTKTPIKKLIITLAIPTIISMLVTAVYNLADTFFVSRLGVSASGAVGVVFPLMAIIQAIGFTLGMGGGSNISAKLGEKKNDEAQRIGSSSFYLSLILGLLFTVFGIIFIDDVLYLLGSTDTVFPYAKDYAKYIIFGAPVMTASFVLNNILRAEGKARFSMVGLSIGGILNCFLDPLFIYGFNMGIAGAAVATLISQCISFAILLSFFLMRKSIITLSIKNVSFKFGPYLEIINVGLPSLARQGLASVSTIILNTQAGIYGGDPALSGMSIVSKVFMIIFSISLGIGQGYQPVCGYNYSSHNYKRVKEAMLFTYIVSTIIMTLMAGLFFIFSEQTIYLFLGEEAKEIDKVIEIGGAALRYQCLVMPFMSINVICNMTYQATRKKLTATILSCCRQGIFFIPCAFILPSFLGICGVEAIQPISDILTSLFSIPFFLYFIKLLNEQQLKLQEENN